MAVSTSNVLVEQIVVKLLPKANTLSVEEKIGQTFFIGIPTDRLDDEAERLIDEIRPGGICLFARNIKDAEQTRQLTGNLQSMSRTPLFLSIDQEGGLVNRLRRILGPMPPASNVRSVGDSGNSAKIIAECLGMLGMNMNFAPVVDVIDDGRAGFSNGLHSRSYGVSADEVVELASAFLDTLQSNGIVGCVKHFPGLGGSKVDSHEELPSVDVSEPEFRAVDLLPYTRLLSRGGVEAVMVAHAVYPNLDLQEIRQDGRLLPSSLSAGFVSKLLRQELKFDGLVLTDDLEMGAILKNYGIGEASVTALLAGNDMVSICAGVQPMLAAHRAVSEAVDSGRIGIDAIDRKVERIFRLKSRIAAPLDLDLDRIAQLSRETDHLNGALS